MTMLAACPDATTWPDVAFAAVLVAGAIAAVYVFARWV